MLVDADLVVDGQSGSTIDGEPDASEAESGKFTVKLANFEGPFDLLLQLIGKHKLDVTEVALHQVTDDFIAYIRAMGDDWDLGEASEFLLVAATLLDLKAARLLPAADVEDEEDLALLEARDLLFARLLQYKAYKEAAAHLSHLEEAGAKRWPRVVSMEPRYAEALPDLVLGIGPDRLFKLALKQFLPKPGPPTVSIAHIHQVRVSVREHAQLLRDRLRRAGVATFALLVAGCENTLEVVARFLALLELYREGLIDFEQPVSLDELTVRWIGGDASDVEFDIDDYEGTPVPPDSVASSDEGAAPDSEESSDSAVAAGSDVASSPGSEVTPVPEVPAESAVSLTSGVSPGSSLSPGVSSSSASPDASSGSASPGASSGSASLDVSPVSSLMVDVSPVSVSAVFGVLDATTGAEAAVGLGASSEAGASLDAGLPVRFGNGVGFPPAYDDVSGFGHGSDGGSAEAVPGTSGATMSDPAADGPGSLDSPVASPDLDMGVPGSGGNGHGGSGNENTAGGDAPALEEHRE